MIENNNINQIYKDIIKDVNDNFDYEVSPRGMPIREKIAYQFKLTNPLDCLVTLKERKLNYRFAVIEKFEYLYGIHDPERIIAYNPNMASFKGAYEYFDGNYAQRFNFWIDHVYHILKKDPDSRQAVISIYDITARHQSADIPCTLSLQFLLRKGKLNLITTMRSNDLLWGTVYDVNAFCFIQEVMAYWLGVEVGTYIHQAGSLHLYLNEHYDKLIKTSQSDELVDMENPKWDLNYKNTQKYLPLFFHVENLIRTGSYYNPHMKLELPIVLQKYIDILQTKWSK